MNSATFVAQKKEFDRQIKEARRAAIYALTLEEKLACIARAKILQNHKSAFVQKFK